MNARNTRTFGLGGVAGLAGGLTIALGIWLAGRAHTRDLGLELNSEQQTHERTRDALATCQDRELLYEAHAQLTWTIVELQDQNFGLARTRVDEVRQLVDSFHDETRSGFDSDRLHAASAALDRIELTPAGSPEAQIAAVVNAASALHGVLEGSL